MTAALTLAIAIVMAPMSTGAAGSLGNDSGSCTAWTSWGKPPGTIRVLRIHRRGSSVPKRIETWDLDRYVAAVMASGAWPNRVWESAKVGALAISQYSRWMIRHHQPGHSWRGRCYDISDQEQYLRPDVRPGSHLPVRTTRVVRLMSGVWLTKRGRAWRTGWSGGRCNDGWHSCEDSIRGLAERGYGWRLIVRTVLSPVTIRGDVK